MTVTHALLVAFAHPLKFAALRFAFVDTSDALTDTVRRQIKAAKPNLKLMLDCEELFPQE